MAVAPMRTYSRPDALKGGTAAYMSPEQTRGKPVAPRARTAVP